MHTTSLPLSSVQQDQSVAGHPSLIAGDTRSSRVRDMVLSRERCRSKVRGAMECRNHGGINRTYLSAVEWAERNISIDNIARIAKGLKIEPWKLLKDD